MKYRHLFFLLLFLSACNLGNKQIKNANELIITLPFFNQPDWTPEWIGKNDVQYQKIHTIPFFSFHDQNDSTISLHTIKNKIYVSNFFFTKCKGICPKMTNNMLLLQEAFKDDTSILFLSHSVDPVSDSVRVLKQYAKENKVNSSRWHLLTGSKQEIYDLAKKQYFAGDSVGYYQSGNEFLLTENFILVDKHQRIRGVYNGTLLVEIDRIKEDIKNLKMGN